MKNIKTTKAKLWEVEFGDNYDKVVVNAQNIEEAVKKALQNIGYNGMEMKDVARVELIAEED